MVAPDHWLPLSVASARRSLGSRKTLAIAAALGVTHSATSALVAVLVLLVGEVVAGLVHYLNTAGFILLIVVAVYFFLAGAAEAKAPRTSEHVALGSAVAVSVFPDFALVPLVLLASPYGATYVGQLLAVFAVVSASSLTAVTAAARRGLLKSMERMPPYYSDYAVALILVITAFAFVLI